MSARDDFLASHPGDDQNEIDEYHAWADYLGYPDHRSADPEVQRGIGD